MPVYIVAAGDGTRGTAPQAGTCRSDQGRRFFVKVTGIRGAVLAATVACGIGGLAMTAAPAGAAITAAPAPAHLSRPSVAANVVIVTCAGKGVQHPRTYVIACGDGNDYLKVSIWGFWNSKAGGQGKDWINTCTPSCAAGKFKSYPVNISLWRVKNWPHHAGKHYFSRMTLTYTKTVPKGFSKKRTVDLPS
jgi:hypothetical protein